MIIQGITYRNDYSFTQWRGYFVPDINKNASNKFYLILI